MPRSRRLCSSVSLYHQYQQFVQGLRYSCITPYHASPPSAPRVIETGGGKPNHSVPVKAPAAMTPHHGSAVNGPLAVAGALPEEIPEAGE